MKYIKEPATANSPTAEDLLFDTDQYSWWARQLHPSAVRRLENGFEGIFRRSLLQLMPADELGSHFDEQIGRPTKELYSMAGLILIGEFRNYTVDETADAYTYDASVQYALDVKRDGQYVCPRTIDNYRKLFREDQLAQDVFLKVTATLVKELNLNIEKQRIDSTHVLSNMAIFTRHQLLATGVKRFLNFLKTKFPECFDSLNQELRERYEASDQRLYFGEVANPSKPTKEEKLKITDQIGADMQGLIDNFQSHAEISKSDAFEKLDRLFNEHFELIKPSQKEPEDDGNPPKIKLRKSSVSSSGSKANTLQNTSDEGAGYGGPKGPGYQAQIAQAHPPIDEEGNAEGPGMITGLIAESAANHDGNALEPMLAQQQGSGLLGNHMEADTHYGADENVCMAKDEYGVEIVSPVSGAKEYPESKQPNKPANPGTKAASLQAQKERLDNRRKEQQTDEWKHIYAKRAGIEGVNRALDLSTGFKRLRVRGDKAVGMSIYLKGAGWNISSAAKIKAKRARKAAVLIPKLIYRLQNALKRWWKERVATTQIYYIFPVG